MSEIASDSLQDATHDGSSSKWQNKVLLKAVTIELAKPQRKRSTLSVTLGDKRGKKDSGQWEYTSIRWEPGQAWDVTDGGIIMASWKCHCPLKWSRKTKIDIDKILHSVRKGKSGAESGPDGVREHDHNVYEDKRCKITMNFGILGDPQPKSLPALVKSAKEDIDKTKNACARLGFCVRCLEGILPFGELVKEIHPVIKVTIAILSTSIEILKAEETFNQAIVDIFDSMCDMVDYVADVNQFATIAQLKTVIEEANTLMYKAVDFFNKHKQRGILGRAFAAFSPSTKEELEELQMDLSRFKDKFDRGILLHTMVAADELKSRLKELETQIKELVRANDDDKVLEILDTRHQTRALRCLDGTREDLISFILEWVRNIEIALNILWIYGYPGAGKSTLAMHIANLFRVAHRLGVIVEFNRNTGVTAVTLWKTITYALAREYRECRSVIVTKIKSGSLDLANATSREVFNQLVVEPLQRLTTSDTKIPQSRLPVIIIDALDEAGGFDESSRKARKEVLDCLADWSKLVPGIKLIITSRAEQDIRLAFSKVPHKKLELPTGSSVTQMSQSTRDIQLYLRNEFMNIATENEIAGDWPSGEIVADLARRAQGVFIWATTIVRFIDPDPQNHLREILEGQFPAGNVYALYRQILDNSFPHGYNADNFVAVVGAIIVLQQPFVPTELAQLSGVDLGTINSVLRGLRAVLDDGDAVRFKHQSFVDFLTRGDDQTTRLLSDGPITCPPRFSIDISDAHDCLCKSLLRYMHKELHFNICNIPSSFMRNDELPRSYFEDAIGRLLAYACQFWSFHLLNARSELDLDLIKTFVYEDLLSWIESLSGLESLAIAAPSLVSLMERFSSNPQQATNLKLLVKDAIQFIRYFALAISQSAAHLYITALTFAPKSSLIAQLYAPRFKNIMQLELGQLNGWPSEQAVIRGHSFGVKFVAFSPDGKQVVSCSSDMTIRVSDVETGQIVAGPFKGHRRRVLCVAYSIDGKVILSFSADRTIRRWSTDCGIIDAPAVHVAVEVDELAEDMYCAAFSHNRKYISFVRTQDIADAGSISRNAVFVRDVETGRAVSDPIVGHVHRINCIAFSPDDTCIASGSDDGSVRVCDTQSGELVMGPLTGDLGPVTSISYSQDGAYIASGLDNGAIQLWDVRGVPHQVRVYRGYTGPIFCVAFSSDDRLIVSGCFDRTVQAWEVKTGQIVAGPFEGHISSVQTVTFSPDSKRIASGSDDGHVCIWDVEVNAAFGMPLGGQSGVIQRFALSKDSERIVLASNNRSIQIRDTRTGRLVGRPFFELHGGSVRSLAYSHDSKRVVCGSSDGRICIWDIATGETVMELDINIGEVGVVLYLNNGRYIASTLYSKTKNSPAIRIWKAETGECIPTLRVETGRYVQLIAFSAEDRLIVSDSKNVCESPVNRIWNVESGNLLVELESQAQMDEYTPPLLSATFSHDGKLVATGSQNGIRLWDATTGKLLLCWFGGYTSSAFSVSFSSDDKFIVSGSDDDTIRVWDAKTGHAIMGLFRGHTATIYSVSFIHDDKYIISGSNDGTIRIWPMEQTQQSLFTDQSEIDRDGWVKGANGELLFWVPLRHRANLHRPGNTWIIAPYSTRLNFGNVRWGADWTECYTP